MLIKSVLATEAVYCLRDICSMFTQIPQCLGGKREKGGLQSELTLIDQVLCIKHYRLCILISIVLFNIESL